jgi:peptidase E
MPQLFLASATSETLKHFINKAKLNPSQTKVLFIADAAEPYKFKGEETPWIDPDRQAFLKEGFEVVEISLEEFVGEADKILNQVHDDKSGDQDDTKLNKVTILHICGGHTLYLLNKIQKCNLVATIQDLVLSDQIIYSGSSAGCMIVAPDLSVKKDLNDEPETWAKYLSDFTDYFGLNLVDFLIVPHFNIPEYSPYNQEYIKNSRFNTPLLFLSDNQAVWVKDRKFEIVTCK